MAYRLNLKYILLSIGMYGKVKIISASIGMSDHIRKLPNLFPLVTRSGDKNIVSIDF